MPTGRPPSWLAYGAALTLPLVGALSLFGGGWWSFSLSVEAFVIVPLLEVLLAPRRDRADPSTYAARARERRFTWMLQLLAATVFVGLAVYLWRVTRLELAWLERVGTTFSIGTLLGAGGIVVAHELGHRRRTLDRALAQALLHASWYPHFFVEHNEGHHVHVATPEDPASARFGEGFWRFLPRVLAGTLRSAARIGGQEASKRGRPAISLANPIVRMAAIQGLASLVCLALLGAEALAAWVVVGAVGILHLELVDYIEHYGLVRRRLPSGEYEPVAPRHSWNSDHIAGRLLLFELPRHSDHHAQAARPYQALRTLDEAPQMPAGYPAMMLLALVPSAWRRVMDPRAASFQASAGPLVE